MSENCSIISAPLLAAFIEKYGVEEGVRRYQRGEEIEPTKTEKLTTPGMDIGQVICDIEDTTGKLVVEIEFPHHQLQTGTTPYRIILREV